MHHDEVHSLLRVADMPFAAIEERIRTCPSLIMPVGGLEPIGDRLPLGMVNACCEAIADEIGKRSGVPVAPLLAYGNGILFKSFGGAAGIHRDTLATVLCEICNCWLFHGFKRIMVLTLAMDGRKAVEIAARRLNKLPGHEDSVRFSSLQDEERFRAYCAANGGGEEHGRSEWGIRALAAFIRPETGAATTVAAKKNSAIDAAVFKQWHRRGRDPEKLRKLAPDAMFSDSAGGAIDADAGRELFETTVASLTDEFSPFLTFRNNASR
jgi:creatinine amidohydrolase